MIKAFFIALGLLTRIPVPKVFHVNKDDSETLYGWSVLFYPLVGLLIGGLLVLISWSFSFLNFPPHGLIEAGLLLLFWVIITGALHLDGLADSADAWLGGYGDQQRTLEIMKDPYSGPAGVVALVLVLLLKFSLLINVSWQLLLLAPVIARTAVMVLLATTPYVRAGGMGEVASKMIPKSHIGIVLFVVIVLSIILLQEQSWSLLLVAVVVYLLRSLMLKRISGTTGDTAGAMIEVVEVSVMLLLMIVIKYQ